MGDRVREYEEAMSLTFTALPKNNDGNLDHQTVRYFLHRFFSQRHGWFIRGLEPENATWSPPPNAQHGLLWVGEWVPTFLQEVLDNRTQGRGAALHDVAAMAAALEDLIRNEAKTRIELAYEIEGLNVNDSITRSDAKKVLDTFFLSFLLANNLTAPDVRVLNKRKVIFSQKYANYSDVYKFYEGILHRGISKKNQSFDAVSKTAFLFGEEYHQFNENECTSLRDTLQGLESRRPGRVRLSTFYNMSRFTHWRFTEKVDYLRTLGAIDDSDPNMPSVIIPNYIMARPNCLDVSNLYAVCCRNACEDLMIQLEKEFTAHTATPALIAEVVSGMKTKLVDAPRVLPPALLARLEEVADHHSGSVPIHGRLFSQWMHHAFPLECPYPHQQGSTNPLTANEWQAGMGSAEVTEEEIRVQVEKDVCAMSEGGLIECNQDTELPWTMAEDILGSYEDMSDEHSVDSKGVIFVGVALVCFGAALLLAALALGSSKRLSMHASQLLHKNRSAGKFLHLSVVLLLCITAYSMEVLDDFVFVIVLLSCLAVFVMSTVGGRATAPKGKDMYLPKV